MIESMVERFSGASLRRVSGRDRHRNKRHELRLQIERLEDRRLLAANLDIQPEWFRSLDELPDRGTGSKFVGPVRPESTHASHTSQWIVQLSQDAVANIDSMEDADRLLDGAHVNFDLIRGLGASGLLLVEGASEDELFTLQALESNSFLTSYSPNERVAGSRTPNDDEFGNMIGLNNEGDIVGLAVDADINALDAWDETTGSKNVVVGVIDTGVDATHPDLFLNIWLNQGEIPADLRDDLHDIDQDGRYTFYDLNNLVATEEGFVVGSTGELAKGEQLFQTPFASGLNGALVADINGNQRIDAQDLLRDERWADQIDNDGNGFFADDLFGWNFRAGRDDEPFAPNDPSDAQSHGTHVAGTIAAIGNNGIGVTGLNWESSIMALRFLDQNNEGDTADAIAAINYATMMRTREEFPVNIPVLNNSWGQAGGRNLALRDAIEASGEADILFVAAAGNGDALGQGVNNDVTPFYPASYELDNIIAVGASDSNNAIATFSNFGSESVDVFAPGVGIISTLPEGRYGTANGTSMAAPHVAGTAALIQARVEGATALEVRQAIINSAKAVVSRPDGVSGLRINAGNALVDPAFAPRSELLPAIFVEPFREVSPSDPFHETEPNNALFTPQEIDDGPWNTIENPNIEESGGIPHLSIIAGGDGTADYYRFTVEAPSRAIFDIDSVSDSAFAIADLTLDLYDENGAFVSTSFNAPQDLGSTSGNDPFIDVELTAGSYVIGVTQGFSFAGVPVDTSYTLHASVENHVTVDPVPLDGFFPNDLSPMGTVAVPLGTKLNIDNGPWNAEFQLDITESTTIPHLSIAGTGDGTVDVYEFTVSEAGERGIFDIDDATIDLARGSEQEPNDSFATAQNIDGAIWNRGAQLNDDDGSDRSDRSDITDSTLIPHTSITGRAGTDDDVDFYSFTVSTPGARGVFDIDDASTFDSTLTLYDADEEVLVSRSDHDVEDEGSNQLQDAFLEYIFPDAGLYTIAVSGDNAVSGENSGAYTLHFSVEDHEIGPRPTFDPTLTIHAEDGSILAPFDPLGESCLANDIPVGDRCRIETGGPTFDAGSNSPFDTLLEYQFPEAGTYTVVVSSRLSGIPAEHSYTLHASLENHATDDTIEPNLIAVQSSNPLPLTLRYTDLAGIDLDTISVENITVRQTSTGDVFLPAPFETDVLPTDEGRSVFATYRFDPPGGSWDPLDFGTYVIELAPTSVANTEGVAAVAKELGSFQVGIENDSSFILNQVAEEDDSGFMVFPDTVDVSLADPMPVDANGNISLRSAIEQANQKSAPQFIFLNEGVYKLELEGDEDLAHSGDLDIIGNLTIVGQGAGTIIDANGIDRVFDVHPGARLNLLNLTITGGNADRGGGIRVRKAGSVDVPVRSQEPNDFVVDAQPLDDLAWNVQPQPNITDSTTIPHLSINGDFADFDFADVYQFTAEAGQRGIFDLDDATIDDVSLLLLDASGGLVAESSPFDLPIDVVFPNDGTYFIQVKNFFGENTAYTLHASVENHAVNPVTLPAAHAVLTRVAIEGNLADEGGGIANDGILFVNESVLANNTSDQKGGALFESAGGETDVAKTTFDSNRSNSRLASAIFSEGRLLLAQSTITGHDQSAGVTMIEVAGKAFILTDPLALQPGSPGVFVHQSTISGNGDDRLLDVAHGAYLEVLNSTIVNNTSIEAIGTAGSTKIQDSLFAGNNGLDINRLNDMSPFSSSHNIFSRLENVTKDETDQIRPDAIAFLGPLADNGGATMTHQLLKGSTAIDAGSVQGGAVVEQEPNNSVLTGQDLESSVWLKQQDPDPAIPNQLELNGDVLPHVTIEGRGDGTFDYYQFKIEPKMEGDEPNMEGEKTTSTYIFDIDVDRSSSLSFDSELFLFKLVGSTATLVGQNDDAATIDAGSTSRLDSFLKIELEAGDYVIGVGQFDSFAFNPFFFNPFFFDPFQGILGSPSQGIQGSRPNAGVEYTLHVVGEGHAEVSGFGEDQRGFRLPQDGDGNGAGISDIGAFEKTLGSVSGVLYLDLDGDRARDPNEPGIEGQTVYVDRNQNGQFDLGEPSVESGGDDPATADIVETGRYRFDGIGAGEVSIGQILENQFLATEVGFGAIERASLGAGGSESALGSFGPSLSGDGRFVAYGQFVNEDRPEVDYLVHDRQHDVIQVLRLPDDETGVGERSSVGPNGEGDGNPLVFGETPSISDDGNLITFVTKKKNPSLTDFTNVYLYDRINDDLTRVSSPTDPGSDGNSFQPHISADGSVIVYTSEASNLVPGDENAVSDVFLYNIAEKTNQLISVPDLTEFVELELSNNDGQNVDDAPWNLQADDNIAQSTSIPHLTILGAGDGTPDRYSFEVPHDNARGIFDIDFGDGSFNSQLTLYNSLGAMLILGDDSMVTDGGAGSTSPLDAFIDYHFATAGTYVVEVSRSGSTPLQNGDTYTLHISIDDHPLAQGNQPSYRPTVSGNGTVVTFASQAANLVDGDTNFLEDVFFVDLDPQSDFRFQESGLVNGSLQIPQNIDQAPWNLQQDDNIANSETIPHVSIEGTGDDTFDYYSFTVGSAGDRGIFDIDFGFGGNGPFDSELFLYDEGGRLLASNDDRSTADGGGGSTSILDSFIDHNFALPGTYIIAVGEFNSFDNPRAAGVDGRRPSSGADYVLQISVANHELVTPDPPEQSLTIVTNTPSGQPSNCESLDDGTPCDAAYPVISDNGQFIVFRSKAGNLLSDDGIVDIHDGPGGDIFLYDRDRGTIELVNKNTRGVQTEGQNRAPSISADGRFIVYESTEEVITEGVFPDSGVTQTYVVDTCNNALSDTCEVSVELISESRAGEMGNSTREGVVRTAISADGSHVAFSTFSGNLVDGDFNGTKDVFVRSTAGLSIQPTVTLNLFAGEDVTDLNFGTKPLAGRIAGKVFEDLSGTGTLSFGPGIDGATVFLDLNGNRDFDPDIETSVETDGAGLYAFEDLPAARRYSIGVIPPAPVMERDFEQAIPSPAAGGMLELFLPAGQNVRNRDFGFIRSQAGGQASGSSTVKGTVFDDTNGNGLLDAEESGVAGITVFLDLDDDGNLDSNETPRSMTTQSDGNYEFKNLAGQAYVVRAILEKDVSQTAPRGHDFDPQEPFDLKTNIRQFTNAQDVATANISKVNGVRDEFPDLIVALFDANEISIRLNNGDGSFSTESVNFPVDPDSAAPADPPGDDNLSARGPLALAVAQLNSNPDPDLIVANNLSSTITVFLDLSQEDDGTITFTSSTKFAAGETPSAIATGDFDNDGHIDIAVTNADETNAGETKGKISVLLNDRAGGFPTRNSFDSGGNRPSSIFAGNFDSHPALDLAVTNADSGNVVVFLGDGNGVFNENEVYPVGENPLSVTGGMLDDDDVFDFLVVANFSSNTASILTNTQSNGMPTGVFEVQDEVLAVGNGPVQVEVEDIEKDGDDDILVTNLLSNPRTVSVLRALDDDPLQFEPAQNFGVAEFGPAANLSFVVDDVNHDGTSDLVVANSHDDIVTVLHNFEGGGAHRIFLSGDSSDVRDGLHIGIQPDLPPKPMITSDEPRPTGDSNFTVTIDFGEEVVGFDRADVVADRANVIGMPVDQGGGRFDVQLAAQVDGVVTIRVDAGAVMDLRGNESIAADPFTITFDGTSPTAVLSSNSGATLNTLTFNVDVRFSEPVDQGSLSMNDFIVMEGSASTPVPFGIDPRDYRFTVTADGDGELTVLLPQGRVQDNAGNSNEASNVLRRTIDRERPEPILTTNVDSPTNQKNFVLTVDFGEMILGGSFQRSDVTVSGAAVNNLQDLQQTVPGRFVLDVTVPDGAGGPVEFGLANRVAEDLAGNLSKPATLNLTVDLVGPTPTIDSSADDPTNADMINVTVVMGSPVVGTITRSELSVVNGTPSDPVLIDAATGTFSFQVEPRVDLEEFDLRVSVNAGAVTDVAGNLSGVSNELVRRIDRKPPKPALTSNVAPETNQAEFSVLVDFLEPTMSGLLRSEITVTGADAGDPQPVDSEGRQFTIPISNADGTVTISVAADAVTDQAGNLSEASESFSRIVNTAALVPELTSDTDPVTNTATFDVTVSFNRNIEGFTHADIAVINGIASDPQPVISPDLGLVQFSFTVEAASDGDVTVLIPADRLEDDAGNQNRLSNTLVRHIDRESPATAIRVLGATPTTATELQVEVDFGEAVVGFDVGDVETSSGVVQRVVSNVRDTLFVVEVSGIADGLFSASIAGGSATDAALNASDAAESNSITVDSTPPTPSISGTESTESGVYDVSIVFDEDIIGLSENDLTVVNASLSQLSGSGRNFTAKVTAESAGQLSVFLPEDRVADEAGNRNVDSNVLMLTLQPTEIVVDGSGQTVDLRSLSDALLSTIERIDIRGTGNNFAILDADKIASLTPNKILLLVSDSGDQITFDAGWQFDRAELVGDQLHRVFVNGEATVRLLGPRNFTNPISRFDVNASGNITSLDVLEIINELRRRVFSTGSNEGQLRDVNEVDLENFRFFDVNLSGSITASDALQVINQLSRQSNISGEAIAMGILEPEARDGSESIRREGNPESLYSKDKASSVAPTRQAAVLEAEAEPLANSDTSVIPADLADAALKTLNDDFSRLSSATG